ncbi:PREDICTED: interaptin-like [Ipomoea nil]|uniref:interaptin-like n=1 Tax=Ipomoea nil TaxID=35883 RepID=UPI000901133C|nr:PREDICTED: interaptin-like [Ipomoea nil]
MAAVSKLRGCIRQIENMNPSGASEEDILDRAKDLMSQDAKFQKGFRFDHIWPILKDLEKFSATPNRDQSPDQVNENNNASERPTGRNKEKKKKQLNKESKEFLKSIQVENEQIKKMFENHQDILQKNIEVQLLKAQTEAKKVELAERQEANKERREEKRECREENKILRINLDSITDPMVRASIRNEQLQIVAKRANEQTSVESSSKFTQYFDNLGGNGGGLGDY